MSVEPKMTKKVIAILTSRFPYEGGEYFLEREARYWEEVNGVEVHIIPFFTTGRLRYCPEWVSLHPDNGISASVLSRLLYVSKAIFSRCLYKEIENQSKFKVLSLSNVLRSVLTLSRVLQMERTLKKIVKDVGVLDVVYSYWNGNSAYAAALLKRKGGVRRLITRAHGTDLYRYALKDSYMPFKDQFVSDFDRVYAVSEGGRAYYVDEYRADPVKISVSRLGVELPGVASLCSSDGHLNCISISNCVPIKRLPIIVDAIDKFSEIHQCVKVSWVHVGDGSDFNELNDYASSLLEKRNNVQFSFTGRLQNVEVLAYLRQNPVDVLVNVSASEGIPVSMMEAMAHGVPVVAPLVGGIPELVVPPDGFLMPAMPSPEDVVEGLEWALANSKSSEVRTSVANRVAKDFSEAINYKSFYSCLIKELECP